MTISTDELDKGEVNSSNEIWIKAGKSFAVPIAIEKPDVTLCWEFTSYPKVWMTYVECTQNDAVLGVHLISQGMNDLCWVYSEWYCVGSSPHIPRYEWLMLSVLRTILCLSSPHIPRYEWLMLSVLRMILCWEFTSYPKVWMTYVECTQNDIVLGVHLISQGMNDLCWVYSEWCCAGSSLHIPRYEWLMLSVLRMMLCWEFTSYPKVWMAYVECTQNDTVLGVHLISQGMNDLCWVYSELCKYCKKLIIPPATKLGGYTGITMSVCPSVHPSVCPSGRIWVSGA